jgi:hypothetical protein
MTDHSSHGRVHVESKGATFVLHADYGQEITHKRVRKLMPGDSFVASEFDGAEKDTWKIFARYVDHIAALGSDNVTAGNFPLDQMVEVLSQPDDVDYSDPLVVQRYQPKAEFHNEDLQDCIDALQELKRSKR